VEIYGKQSVVTNIDADIDAASAHPQVVDVLAALAHSARLRVFRLLVQAGPSGLAAGAIAQTLDIPASTLSFHLAHLSKVHLVTATQQGRQVIYRAAFNRVQWLTNYLLENCCNGAPCAPATACVTPTCGENS
jgi:ArsR family transcriptional regulator, arsenate/arsenite/antimonite-responsive transcriptional repressor